MNANKKIYIVGAGPGDINLLTVKAKKIILNAEVIMHDEVVSESILELAPHAILYNAGFGGYANASHQELLAKKLVSYSLNYSSVVRLKSGDPFLFGNGGETVKFIKEELQNQNISASLEFVPGISSAFAASSSLGLPLTLNGVNKSIAIISGHNDGEIHDYSKLVSFGTIILYMSAITINNHISGFIENGLDRNTPVLVIQKGCHPDERIFFGLLHETSKLVFDNKIQEPAVFIIGKSIEFYKRHIHTPQ